MEPAYIVLLILAVIYVPIWLWVWRFPERAERYHLCKYGPCVMIRTQLGMRTMDRLSRHRRFWRAFGFASKLISAVLFLLMVYMLIVAIMAVPSKLASGSSIGIEYALAIPGFNPILPLSYGVVALIVAMVVHELGHGIQARANDARVDSSGVLYGVVPLGAFVEPNEDDMRQRSRRAQMDMYTAGIAVNTVVAVVAILLLAGCCGAVSSEYDEDAGVYYIDAGSPALLAGIPGSAIVTGIVNADDAGDSWDDGDMEFMTPTYASVSGTQVSLEAEGGFDPTNWYYIVYQTEDGTHVTDRPIQLGAYIRAITVGSPADEAGVQTGVFLYSVTIDGVESKVTSMSGFTAIMSSTSPGDEVVLGFVDVTDYSGTATVTYSEPIRLSERNGVGFLGVGVSTSGMTFTTPGIMMDSAVNPFYGADSAYSYVTSFFGYLSGPFNGSDPIPDDIKWWYDAPGGDLFWIVMSLLYWIFWLDILLAISNALPAYPFDGGFIFAGGVNWLCERLGVRDPERRDRMSESISNSVSTVVLFMFMIVILSFLL